MIKSISIENFRCFHHTKINGFGKVNLIGGQNNAGKTALLEAIYLANNPSAKSIIFLKQKLRNEASDPSHPERTWSSLFYQFDKNAEIKLSVETLDAVFEGRFVCKESYEKQKQNIVIDKKDEDGLIKIEDDSNVGEKVAQSSLVYSQYLQNRNEQEPTMRLDSNLGSKKFGIRDELPKPFLKPNFVPAGFRPNPATLAESFERLRYEDQDQTVLEGIKLIEPTIERAEVFNFGEKRIYLKRKDGPFMPINLFGDALNKISNIIIRIVENANSILLIDEIENGVHYSHHRDLWKFVFQLASQFGVQIFAASHSYEMIKAFNQTAIAEKLGPNAMYFEMYQSLRSGEIIGKDFAPDLLAYAIANNQTFRGE